MRVAWIPFLWIVMVLAFLLSVSLVRAQSGGPDSLGPSVPSIDGPPAHRAIVPVRTDSPRETIDSFRTLTRRIEERVLAYTVNRTQENRDKFDQLASQLRSFIDLSEVPVARREEVAEDTLSAILDIFARVETPAIEAIPEAEEFDDSAPALWRIPRTPLFIARIDEGPRAGEFLFSGRSVVTAPRFYNQIQFLPRRVPFVIDSWTRTLPQTTGPMIPEAVVDAMPPSLRALWLDTPAWKAIAVLALTVIAGTVILIVHQIINRYQIKNRTGHLLRRTLTPALLFIILTALDLFFSSQIDLSGRFSTIVDFSMTLFVYLAVTWIYWCIIRIAFELLILSPTIPDESFDANLLRLISRMIAITGSVIILAYAGSDLGLPVFSVLAGLGIGGLAIALAIRPTLENLIGGIILYIDKPVRLGDFCSVGAHTGTVESIGIRSTQLRSLDRTRISIPNAQFADMQITNWAKCDQMLIQETIGVRYETTPDQLRYVMAKMREMLHAHPRIASDTIRVRFAGYGDSALNISMRIYAETREWNDFFAIREDIFLRIYDLVTEAGTGFAFPSRTVYMGQDDGLDKQRGEAAVQQVRTWRRLGRLPFPRLPPERMEQLEATLDYPPKGSPEVGGEIQTESAERLSAEPLETEPEHEETEESRKRSDQ